MQGFVNKVLTFQDGLQCSFAQVALAENTLQDYEFLTKKPHGQFLLSCVPEKVHSWYLGDDIAVVPRVVLALLNHPTSKKDALDHVGQSKASRELVARYFEWKATLNTSKPRLIWNFVYFTPSVLPCFLFPGRYNSKNLFLACQNNPESLHELIIMLFYKYHIVFRKKGQLKSEETTIKPFELTEPDKNVKLYRLAAKAVLAYRNYLLEQYAVMRSRRTKRPKFAGSCIVLHKMEDICNMWVDWMSPKGMYKILLAEKDKPSFKMLWYYLYHVLLDKALCGEPESGQYVIYLIHVVASDTRDHIAALDNTNTIGYLEPNRIPGTL